MKRVVSVFCFSILPALLLAFSVGSPASAATMVETNGTWFVASPQFFGSADSGTYYNPSSIEANGYSFLFTQGGQFSSSTSPVPWCAGDMITLWRAPLSGADVRSAFSPLRRISPCHSTGSTTVHWTMTSAVESVSSNSVLLIVERQAVDLSTGNQISSEHWLLEGEFNAAGDDIDTWSADKLYSIDPSAIPRGRIVSVAITEDTSRSTPNDGYLHDMYRGFARQPAFNTVELRLDFSQKYCDQGTSSSPDLCVLVEYKTSSGWQPVVNGYLDFKPATKIAQFIPGDIVTRNGVRELWGKALLDGNDCPCDRGVKAAQYRWYTIDPSTFALSGLNSLFSQVRCMPAEPHNFRVGVDLIQVGTTDYLVSGQNDDQSCSATRPFVGQDTVTTVVQ